MARTQLSVTTLSRDGADLSTTAVDTVNGNSFPIDSSGEVLIAFFAAGACAITIHVPEKVDQTLAVEDRVLTLTPGTVKLWMCDAPSVYRQDDGNVYFDASSACSVALYSV